MKVRDLTMKVTEYKGRLTEAYDRECPCRPCYNAHDCGRMGWGGGWRDMQCATRYNFGCPHPMPDPQHIRPTPRTRKCQRCGAWAVRDA